MITVHMIGNAHLDPVWFWEKSEGTDAVLATARSACKRLDEYPELIFTCSSSWFYRQAELVDPALFARIVGFIASGRWHIVGGMVVQPDCNFPSPEGFHKQFRHAQEYFQSRFGRKTTIGYNVDSFGHTAYLPRFLRQAGMDTYVFMRPAKEQVQLPANVFRWRSPDGFEVTAFRIAAGYGFDDEDLAGHIQNALKEKPPELEHTMCFYGVGDHGGGPTKKQIEWIIRNAQAIDGVRLVFSHPAKFFEAIRGQIPQLPVYEGELQNMFMGCYMSQRPIKTAMRRAEAALTKAEHTLDRFRENPNRELFQHQLSAAWDKVLFNQFHDLLGGTSLEKASQRAVGELLWAEGVGDDVLTFVTRAGLGDLSKPGEHQLVVFNPSATDFNGVLYYDPWLRAGRITLLDEQGEAVPCQGAERRPVSTALGAFIFQVSVPAWGKRVLTIKREDPIAIEGVDPQNPPPRVGPAVESISNGVASLGASAERATFAGWGVGLEVAQDKSDTWGSSIQKYEGPVLGALIPQGPWRQIEDGPVRWSVRVPVQQGRHCGFWTMSLEKDSPALRLKLRVTWSGGAQILRLRLDAPSAVLGRSDLISGGMIDRPLGLAENYLAGAMTVRTAQGPLSVVSPDIFSASADEKGIRLTLLRTPLYCQTHGVNPDNSPHYPVTDQGTHEFELLFFPGADLAGRSVPEVLAHMTKPPLAWDVTG